jgi:peptidyl-prolyl cis-trans isomerase C
MQPNRRRWFSLLIMAFVLTWISSTVHAEEESASENHVAVVNGSPITQKEFDREMGRVEQMILSKGRHLSTTELAEVKRQVLEGLIGRKLLYQESQKKGIEVEEGAVGKELNRVKEQFATETEFRNALDQAHLSETAVKRQIREELAIQRLIDEQLAGELTVSDKESKTYYDSHTNLFRQPEQVRAIHILIKADPQANESQKAEARQRIEEIQKELQQGEDFEALARQYSECPSAASGGDLQYFKRGQMVKPFEAVAFSLKPGEVSEIVETRFGYHLIKVTEKKSEETLAYEDVKGKIKAYLRREKTQGEMMRYVERLKEGAEVQRLMKTEP